MSSVRTGRALARSLRHASGLIIMLILAGSLLCAKALGQEEDRENKRISAITVVFESSRDDSLAMQFRDLAAEALGPNYSTVKVRDAIEQIYATRRVATVQVEATDAGPDAVAVKFLLKRRTQARRVSIEITDADQSPVNITEQELLFRLNILDAGAIVNDETIQANANLIQQYLRDRGFFRAEVTPVQTPLTDPTEVALVFRVTLNEPARIGAFKIDIAGVDSKIFADELKLDPGEVFSRELLRRDEEKVREILRDEGFLAPTLSEARPIYDPDANKIDIELKGTNGPLVNVEVESERSTPGKGTQRKLLPVKREGTIDYSAIVEGERRLETHYQELGYFFANVTGVCSVEPPVADQTGGAPPQNSEFLCASLTNSDLGDRNVGITYKVDLNRRLKLTDIRLTGTDQFTIDDIKGVLGSQEANILGIIPLFGYGRGYTSQRLLAEDAATIRSLLRELGYRDATVRVNQGVSLDGENLVITFVVDQGQPTIVSDVSITGSVAFTEDQLLAQIPPIVGKNYSRARVRNAQRKLSEFLAQAGYFDSVVEYSIDERSTDPATGVDYFKVLFEIKHRANTLSDSIASVPGDRMTLPGEGQKVYVGRILVTGNDRTKTSAIERAVTIEPGDLLRASDIYTSEQNLYGSDVFSKVEIRERPVGPHPDGRLTDLIVSVEEQAPRILSYGGGYSTDLGASGFVDIRHMNLFGRLWQGGARVRMSQRQQIAQIDFLNPRFMPDGDRRYAPLSITAAYRRDSTVTRFFRSEFDRGTFGIVQRLDEEGNPIDEFGERVNSPTLNSLSFTAETNRTIRRADRSILFFRYRFEDVRLYNIQSLLIKELLEPDARTRISGFGLTFVRDTRQNCNIKYTILEIIARGEPGEPCRYNAGDPTKGSYITADINTSAKFLGANITFNKFQGAYNTYFTPNIFNKRTTFAGRAVLGVGHVFSSRQSFRNYPDLDRLLPISERFFAGGANTLRGFSFESAGPRVVVVPTGTFRNSNGEIVRLDPFTVPFGGNALAIVNLEARIRVSDALRVVPFYDGGNVFKSFKDMIRPPDVADSDVTGKNLRALWTHTLGLGLRIKTPIGGEFGIDYGHLLNPPEFLIPQGPGVPNAIYRLRQSQVHFRFSQAF